MAKSLLWRPYILSSTRTHLLPRQPLLSPAFVQQQAVSASSLHSSDKSKSNSLFRPNSNATNRANRQVNSSCGNRKLPNPVFGEVGHRRFITRATDVNDAGFIDSPLMQSMEKKIKEHLNADSVIVKDAYGDGRHVSIDVISSAFEGQSAVNRQRMVYKAIWEELQTTVHAVDQMTTRTPNEAAARK
ncbi:hypothetical protein K2173_026501 [Erythroxylum novogranatense]|uniref:Protein BOLA4, chloroplastic/mitochondrial n=1 Tax=Erythroxylum novogranatense TaxID=1862640 RepID=A0AAV8TZ77_9ROSI|nr:hypothetical protein K2173_026501 [Erythroxylum novogranatense]